MAFMLVITQSSTVQVGQYGSRDCPKVTHAVKNAAFKIHSRDILRDKYHLYRIALVHLTSITAIKTRKLSGGWI